MPKRLLRLPDDAISMLSGLAETGMGFYVVKGRFPQAYVDNVYVVAGNHYLVPLRHAEYFSVADLMDGATLPETAESAASFHLESSAASRHAAALPTGYKPPQETMTVSAALTLEQPMVMCRYLGSEDDPRLVDGQLAKGSFVTTRLDLSEARTGYAATSRFGHPLPAPLCCVVEYEIPAGISLQLATVPPCFGQGGGGIEARLVTSAPVPAPRRVRLPIL